MITDRKSEATYPISIVNINCIIKFLNSMLFVVAIGFSNSPILLIYYLILLLVVFAIHQVNPLKFFTLVKPFIFLLIFTFTAQLFVSPSGSFVSPSMDSLNKASLISFKLVLIIGYSSIFIITVNSIEMIKVFKTFFTPLKIFNIQPTQLALSMLITVRFIPVLITEGYRIIDSQRLRNIFPLKDEPLKIKKLLLSPITLTIPMIVRAFNYADKLSVTLRYRNADYLFEKRNIFTKNDIAVLILAILLSIGVLIVTKFRQSLPL